MYSKSSFSESRLYAEPIDGRCMQCKTKAKLEHPLNIFNIFRNSGPGSLSLTTTWNNRSCTMSYMPIRCSGISPRALRYRMVTFRGSHCSCGQSEMSMSKPSSWVVGGRVRARSSSQILWGWRCFRSTYLFKSGEGFWGVIFALDFSFHI